MEFNENLDLLVKIYNQKLSSDKMEEYLLKNFHEPYKNSLKELYEKNCQLLKDYRFWKMRDSLPLSDFDSLNVKMLTDGKGHYYAFNTVTKIIPPPPRFADAGNTVTKPLFRDLSKPLFINDEFNRAHFEYLEDNVRLSEDFGGDNHIYMSYASPELFYLLLQTIDLTPFLAREKFIFLIGDEKDTMYPLNFKEEYGIDYDAVEPKPVRLDELKRLLINWHTSGSNGSTFFAGLMDTHPNLINIKTFGGDFPEFYNGVLKGKNVAEMVQALSANKDRVVYAHIMYMLNPNDRDVEGSCPAPTYEAFVNELLKIFPGGYRPNMGEWFRGLALAYSYAIGRDLKARISPAVFFYTHRYIAPGPLLSLMKEAVEDFKYVRAVSIMRRITTSIASTMRISIYISGVPLTPQRVGNLSFPPLWFFRFVEEKSGLESNGYCLKPDDEYLPHRRIVRFEDLKLQPKATLEAICDWFDLPWSDTLLLPTVNGAVQHYRGSGSKANIMGFDTASVYNRYEALISSFDGYRMELLMPDLMEVYGYKPIYHTDGEKYSIEEIADMFKAHFKVMTLFKNFPDNMLNIRDDMINKIKKHLMKGCLKDSEGNDLTPIPLLKPKPEFIEGEVYE